MVEGRGTVPIAKREEEGKVEGSEQGGGWEGGSEGE